MSIAIPGFTPTSPVSSNSNSTSSGLNSLSGSDFMKLMLTQLEQQDPLNPTDSNQMLSQLSQISNLQSNTAMQTSLSSLTLQQSIGAGGNLIGKSISALSTDGTNGVITGTVTSVQVIDKNVYLGLDNGSAVAMANITSIAPAPATPVTPAALPAAKTSVASDVVNALASVLGG